MLADRLTVGWPGEDARRCTG